MEVADGGLVLAEAPVDRDLGDAVLLRPEQDPAPAKTCAARARATSGGAPSLLVAAAAAASAFACGTRASATASCALRFAISLRNRCTSAMLPSASAIPWEEI